MNDPNVRKVFIQTLGPVDAEHALAQLPSTAEVILQLERRVLVAIVPTLEVRVDGLPLPYFLNGFCAWSSPSLYARRFYSETFGSACLVEKVGDSTRDVKLADGVVRRDRVVTVFCRTIWCQITAAERIVRFVSRRGSLKERRKFPEMPLVHGRTSSLHVLSSSAPPQTNALSSAYKITIVRRCLGGFRAGHKKPRAVFMFGFPGSGKNYVLRKRPRIDHIIIDVDLCLENIPAYWHGVASRNRDDWVYGIRGEAHSVANMLLEAAVDQRSHFVWNGTGRSYKFYFELIERLHALHYVVELCGVYARASTARERMKTRVRPVPKRILVDAIGSVPENFKRLTFFADHARVWANDGCVEPSIIWDKHHGILDANAWRTWECPSPLPLSPRTLVDGKVWGLRKPTTLPLIIVNKEKRPRSGSM